MTQVDWMEKRRELLHDIEIERDRSRRHTFWLGFAIGVWSTLFVLGAIATIMSDVKAAG